MRHAAFLRPAPSRAPAASVLGVALCLALCVTTWGAVAARGATARSEKLSASEQKWAKPMIAIWNGVNGNLRVFTQEATAKNALIAGSGKNNTLFSRTLVVLASCPAAAKQAGSPPSTRLKAFADSMTTMCTHVGAGSLDVAKAIGAIGKGNGKQAAALLKRATGELEQATKLLRRARTQLLALGGKSAFTA